MTVPTTEQITEPAPPPTAPESAPEVTPRDPLDRAKRRARLWRGVLWTLSVLLAAAAGAAGAAWTLYRYTIQPLEKRFAEYGTVLRRIETENRKLRWKNAALEQETRSLTEAAQGMRSANEALETRADEASDLRTRIAELEAEVATREAQLQEAMASSAQRQAGPRAAAGDTPFVTRSPQGRISDDRPEFTWSAHPRAARYAVAVKNASGAVVARSPRALTASRWRPARPLRHDGALEWTVTAYDRDGDEIAKASGQFQPPAAGGEGEDP